MALAATLRAAVFRILPVILSSSEAGAKRHLYVILVLKVGYGIRTVQKLLGDLHECHMHIEDEYGKLIRYKV
ncbi:hypothetical protein MELA_02799 [Candidatus Methylomirabilis lanthanidiphila]|uniref:Uncharacterized protein n=1 Tax=Candidatus Methylomirabilis lanthanidiphila TaxID=2211376 RepID=A0A564ZMT1_9BACT|nr:hypothetical protein MELA_02799 [Candidatus Methylomirabilis lanthanidiphila]